jgi:hypothetical protein
MRPLKFRAWLSALIALAGSAVIASGCGLLSGDSSSGAAPARQERHFTESELKNLLLPRGMVPAGLAGGESFLVPNDMVAALLPDPAAARTAMETTGRVQGAAIGYEQGSTRRAGEQVFAVASSVSWYNTSAGAEAVISDPTMELALHGLGLKTAEIEGRRIGQESRIFRGFRDGDRPDLAAYVVLFRRVNLIGAVVVVVPATTDDGGRLALDLARKQAAIPMSNTAR